MKNLVPNRPPKKWLIVRALLLKIHEQVLNGTKPENSAPKTATATVRQWPLLWPVHARGSSSPAIEPTKVAQQRCPQSRWPPPQRIHTTSDRFELPKKKSLRVIFCFDWTRKKSMTRKYSKLSRMGFEVFTMWKHSMHSSYVAHKYSTSVGSGNNPWSHRSIFRLRWNRSTCPLIRIWGITTSHMQL